jgi:hypothetical protein
LRVVEGSDEVDRFLPPDDVTDLTSNRRRVVPVLAQVEEDVVVSAAAVRRVVGLTIGDVDVVVTSAGVDAVDSVSGVAGKLVDSVRGLWTARSGVGVNAVVAVVAEIVSLPAPPTRVSPPLLP